MSCLCSLASSAVRTTSELGQACVTIFPPRRTDFRDWRGTFCPQWLDDCVTHLNTQLSRLVCKQHILLLVHVMHTLPVMHTLLAPGHAYVAGSRSLRHRFVVHIACTHKTITSSQRDTQRIGQSERAADDLRDQSIDRGSTLQWPYIHRTAPSIPLGSRQPGLTLARRTDTRSDQV